VIRLPGESNAAIARYRMRTFVNVPSPLNTTAEVDALRRDLMVTEATPPLTLSATTALITAQRGDFVAVGGEIVGTYLESVITRFASLPQPAIVLTPLGSLPQEQSGHNFLTQMLMRFDLKPHWVQHDQFFVTLE
jgi:hypothetical protein